MIKIKSKILTIFAASILILSMVSATILLQTVSAHNPPQNILTSSFIHIAPNPAGVGQTVTIGFWLNQPPPTAAGPYGDRWNSMTVVMTKPDGTKQTFGPFETDDTGGTYTTFTPDRTGKYDFQMFFAGEVLEGKNLRPGTSTAYVGDYFMPSQSDVATLTVQDEPVSGVSGAPLPTSYWERPINSLNVHEWYKISGASLFVTGYSTSRGSMYSVGNNFNPYTEAPQTAHIIWTQPAAYGGVLGGQFGGTTTYGNYYSTQQYEHRYEPVVMNGYIYYTQFPGSSRNPTANICMDLRTGEIVWSDDATNYGGGNPAQTALDSNGLVTPIYCGQLNDYVSPNQYGGIAYLWTTGTPDGIYSRGTCYNMFDAMTGKYILSIVNGTSMTMTVDDHGSLIGYYVDSSTNNEYNAPTLNMWNSTHCVIEGTNGEAAWQWRPTQNAAIDFSLGIEYSRPIATRVVPNDASTVIPRTLGIRNCDGETLVLNCYAPGTTNYYQGGWGVFAGYDCATGQQLWIWNKTFTPYAGDVNTGTSTCGEGIFTISLKSTFEMQGYDMKTGKLLWTTPLKGYNNAMPDSYATAGGYCEVIAYNSVYYASFGGDIWSLDTQTGKVNWYTNTTAIQGPAGTETPYGIWPIWTFSNGGVADGLLFLAEGHEYSPPLFLGAKQLAINCTTGEAAWIIDAFNVDSHPVTAYGVMTTLNAYDNQIYAYAKGPSKLTVSAPGAGVTTDTPVTITGTITDISAGSNQNAVAMNFPNGLPCVSDASQSGWMEYVYEQQTCPDNVEGVPVTIDVVDSNGNYRTIGVATSNMYGTYSLNWAPDIPGAYTVIANFDGTLSYYPSTASTAFYASEPVATPTAQPSQTSVADQYLLPGIAGIIIAIAIVGVVLGILLVRKKP